MQFLFGCLKWIKELWMHSKEGQRFPKMENKWSEPCSFLNWLTACRESAQVAAMRVEAARLPKMKKNEAESSGWSRELGYNIGKTAISRKCSRSAEDPLWVFSRILICCLSQTSKEPPVMIRGKEYLLPHKAGNSACSHQLDFWKTP